MRMAKDCRNCDWSEEIEEDMPDVFKTAGQVYCKNPKKGIVGSSVMPWDAEKCEFYEEK